MYKTAIPGLITIETNLRGLHGAYILESLDFFAPSKKKARFHYKIAINNNIKIPETYEFRNGYYLRSDDDWYYHRTFAGITFKMQYNPAKQLFTCNSSYLKLPFAVGGIMPFGKHVADIINIDLFLHNFVVFQGAAVKSNKKVYCFIGPSFNGKTSLVMSLLDQEATYIGEDIIVIDVPKGQVYQCTYAHNFGRKINKRIASHLKSSQQGDLSSSKITKIFFIQNQILSQRRAQKLINHKPIDVISLSSMLFMNNLFARSLIFEAGLFEQILSNTKKYNEKFPSYETALIDSYDASKIIERLVPIS